MVTIAKMIDRTVSMRASLHQRYSERVPSRKQERSPVSFHICTVSGPIRDSGSDIPWKAILLCSIFLVNELP
jgi:hypothetical protein